AQRLRDLHHVAGLHHQRDDVGGRDAELLGQVLYGDPVWVVDGPGRYLRVAALLLTGGPPLAALAGTPAGLRVDHDTAAPARRCAALRAGMAARLAGPLLRRRRRLFAVHEAGPVALRRVRRLRLGGRRS